MRATEDTRGWREKSERRSDVRWEGGGRISSEGDSGFGRGGDRIEGKDCGGCNVDSDCCRGDEICDAVVGGYEEGASCCGEPVRRRFRGLKGIASAAPSVDIDRGSAAAQAKCNVSSGNEGMRPERPEVRSYHRQRCSQFPANSEHVPLSVDLVLWSVSLPQLTVPVPLHLIAP